MMTKAFGVLIIFYYPNRHHDEMKFYHIMSHYSCSKRYFFLIVSYQFFDGYSFLVCPSFITQHSRFKRTREACGHHLVSSSNKKPIKHLGAVGVNASNFRLFMYGDIEKNLGSVRNFKYLMDCYNKKCEKFKFYLIICQSIMLEKSQLDSAIQALGIKTVYGFTEIWLKHYVDEKQ